MNYSYIEKCNLACGEGLRVVLWVSGCPLHCQGCQNEWLQNPEEGKEFDAEAFETLVNYLNHDYINGLTLCGGSPLAPYNIEGTTKIAKLISERFPDKTIWCYTGYKYEDVKDYEIMDYIDVLLDGPFIDSMKKDKLQWVGSANQRVIDVKKSKEIDKIVLY